MNQKNIIVSIVMAMLGALLLLPAVFRDIKLEKAYPSDLRNRQVGSRLMKDGKLPYFFHYSSEQDTRYLDIKNCGNLKVSNVTATPYLHVLLYSICDLPFKTFSTVWLIGTWLLLLLMYILMQNLAGSFLQKVIVWIATIAFPYTEAWKCHVFQGQNYLLIPFLLVLFYWLFIKQSKWFWLLLVGIIGTSIVLIRPTAIFFFLPFVFLLKQYKKQIIAIAGTGVIAACWILFSAFQKSAWQEYQLGVKEHIKIHQQGNPTLFNYVSCPDVKDVEGFPLFMDVKGNRAEVHSESGNFHVLWQMAFKQKIGLNLLYTIELSLIGLLLLFYFLQHKKEKSVSLLNAIFLGFALLMIADLFAPISRAQYNTVQWIFPLLLLSQIRLEGKNRLYAMVFAVGLLLSIVNVAFIKMEHTLGEYLMLAACVFIALNKQTKAKQQRFQ